MRKCLIAIDTTRLKFSVRRPLDDLFLVGGVQVHKVIAVAGHPHQQVAVIVRFGLGLSLYIRIDNVELNVVAVKFEIGSDEACQFFQVFFFFQHVG